MPLRTEIRHHLTAWRRHHRSAGFGIHSPFAYGFVRDVLRQPLPYYAYERIDAVCHNRSQRRNARLFFRIANHFNPGNILLLGGLDEASLMGLLAPCSASRVITDTAPRHTGESVGRRVDTFTTTQAAIKAYLGAASDAPPLPFVVVTSVPASARGAIGENLRRLVQGTAVIALTGLRRDAGQRQLWQSLCAALPHGQTYTNDRLGLIVATPKLQREHFHIWL